MSTQRIKDEIDRLQKQLKIYTIGRLKFEEQLEQIKRDLEHEAEQLTVNARNAFETAQKQIQADAAEEDQLRNQENIEAIKKQYNELSDAKNRFAELFTEFKKEVDQNKVPQVGKLNDINPEKAEKAFLNILNQNLSNSINKLVESGNWQIQSTSPGGSTTLTSASNKTTVTVTAPNQEANNLHPQLSFDSCDDKSEAKDVINSISDSIAKAHEEFNILTDGKVPTPNNSTLKVTVNAESENSLSNVAEALSEKSNLIKLSKITDSPTKEEQLQQIKLEKQLFMSDLNTLLNDLQNFSTHNRTATFKMNTLTGVLSLQDPMPAVSPDHPNMSTQQKLEAQRGAAVGRPYDPRPDLTLG
ncbi:hypothetical protein L3V83_06215 [Thiotrichales bacterium 19X7-9]|nr:hypothetical protein [Thiotrichales bacterium 19X7-9]